MPPRETDTVSSPQVAGVVEGTDEAEVISVGYTDSEGDVFTDDGSVVDAGGGDDTVYGGYGDDTIDGGAGDDWLFGGDGEDVLSGGEGNDTLWGDDGNDTLYGNEGDDKLIGGAGDDVLWGGEGNNLLIGDHNPGDNGGRLPTDPAEPGFGNDTLHTGSGNDTAYGGSGDDVFRVYDDFGNHLIVGGETGETTGDTLDASDMGQSVNLVYTGDEAGTMTRDGAELAFSEIENTRLGSGDDRAEVITSTTGFVHGGDGFDTLVLPDPAPGEPAPQVTVTDEIDNGDGTTSKTGYVIFPDGSRLDFESFEEIICFTPGTRIDTLRGRVAVEDLRAGDQVLTREIGRAHV